MMQKGKLGRGKLKVREKLSWLVLAEGCAEEQAVVLRAPWLLPAVPTVTSVDAPQAKKIPTSHWHLKLADFLSPV